MGKKLKTTLTALTFVFLLAVLAYVSIDVWLLDEDAPESFSGDAPPEPVQCDPELDCTQASYDEWYPLCSTEGNDTFCYDPDNGERICAYADGPYYDDYGAWFYTEWDYCEVLAWDDNDDLNLGVMTVPQEAVGTVTTGALPFVAKFGLNAITGKARMKKAMAEALKEQLRQS